MTCLIHPPEQEPSLSIVMMPGELDQQRLLIGTNPSLSGLMDLEI